MSFERNILPVSHENRKWIVCEIKANYVLNLMYRETQLPYNDRYFLLSSYIDSYFNFIQGFYLYAKICVLPNYDFINNLLYIIEGTNYLLRSHHFIVNDSFHI